MTPNTRQIRRDVKTRMTRYQRKTYLTDNAVLGNGAGVVRISGSKHDCYVRIDGVIMRVRNTKTAMVHGLPVVVGYDHTNPNILQVLAVRERDGIELDTNYGVPEHHELHEYNNSSGGNDVVYSDVRQLMPCRVTSALDAFNIYVHRGMALTNDGVWVRVESADKIDLSSYQPGSGACYVLIYINLEDGSIGKLAGTTATSNQILDYTYIPDAPYNSFPLAAVRLYDAQTVISERYGYDGEIVDLRMSAMSGASRQYVIQYDYSAGDYVFYPPTNAGIVAAMAAAATGDVIMIPPGSFNTNMTMPAGVTVIGAGIGATILSGVSTVSSGVTISNLSFSRTGSSGSDLFPVYIPVATTSVNIHSVLVSCTNSGAGNAYGIYVAGTSGNVYISRSAISADNGGLDITGGMSIYIINSSIDSVVGSTANVYWVGSISSNITRFGSSDDYTELKTSGSLYMSGDAGLYHTVRAVTATGNIAVGDSVILASASGGAVVLTLPAVSGMSGKAYTVVKTDSSTNAVTIDGNGSETINGALTYVLSQQYNTVTLVNNGTAWYVSGAPAQGFANVRSITANYTATLADEKIYASAALGAVTITLPAASTARGKVYSIKKIDNSINAVVVDGNGSETIDGNLTKNINTQWTAVSIYCTGAVWYIE